MTKKLGWALQAKSVECCTEAVGMLRPPLMSRASVCVVIRRLQKTDVIHRVQLLEMSIHNFILWGM